MEINWNQYSTYIDDNNAIQMRLKNYIFHKIIPVLHPGYAIKIGICKDKRRVLLVKFADARFTWFSATEIWEG